MEGTESLLKFVRVGGIPTALLLLLVTVFLGRVVQGFIATLGARFTGRRLLIHQLGTFARFLILIGGIMASALAVFRISNEMLLALAGTCAVAVGFAFKDLTSSIVAGVTILIDRPFQVGDRVTFGGYYGEISSIGLRSVRMVTLDDTLITIPNNKFLTDVVASGNAGALDMLVQIDFYIGIDQDLSRAKKIVRDAATSSRYAYLKKPWGIGISQVVHQGYYAIRLRAKVYVLDVQYEKALETDVTERALQGFRDAKVEPPAILYRDHHRAQVAAIA